MSIIESSDYNFPEVQEAFDFLIDGLGKDCKLIYPAKRQQCENCFFDSVNQRSSNIYNGTGPISFQNIQCPVCQGYGYRMIETTETIKFRLIWTDRETIVGSLPIRVPYGLLETRGYLTDWPKVNEAQEIIAQLPIAPYKEFRYKKMTEGFDNFSIVQNRYFTCMWERQG